MYQSFFLVQKYGKNSVKKYGNNKFFFYERNNKLFSKVK